MIASRPQRERVPSFKLRYAKNETQVIDPNYERENELATASSSLQNKGLKRAAATITQLYCDIQSAYVARFGFSSERSTKTEEPGDFAYDSGSDSPSPRAPKRRKTLKDEKRSGFKSPDLNLEYVRNYPKARSTASGYQRPEIPRNPHGPLMLPEPGTREMTEEDALNSRLFDVAWEKDVERGRIADQLFRQWARWEILGRMRDGNTAAGVPESQRLERIWVKRNLQLRWRVWVQAIPVDGERRWRCKSPGCGKKLSAGTIAVSFEPPQWTQQAETMRRRLVIFEKLVTEYAARKPKTEAGESQDAEDRSSVLPEELEELEHRLLDVDTSTLPRWNTDDWNSLWEPDYALLNTDFLTAQYGKGKRYCIPCFGSLLPPMHTSFRTNATSEGNSIGTSALEINSLAALPGSTSHTGRGSVPITPISLTSRCNSPTDYNPPSKPPAVSTKKTRQRRRTTASTVAPPTPPIPQPLPVSTSTPKIVLRVNGSEKPSLPANSSDSMLPPRPSLTPGLESPITDVRDKPLSLLEVVGDSTINPWTGVYSSVFPDTRGRFAVGKRVNKKVWAWKEACCDIELGDGGEGMEKRPRGMELGRKGLGEVLEVL